MLFLALNYAGSTFCAYLQRQTNVSFRINAVGYTFYLNVSLAFIV